MARLLLARVARSTKRKEKSAYLETQRISGRVSGFLFRAFQTNVRSDDGQLPHVAQNLFLSDETKIEKGNQIKSDHLGGGGGGACMSPST